MISRLGIGRTVLRIALIAPAIHVAQNDPEQEKPNEISAAWKNAAIYEAETIWQRDVYEVCY